MRRKTGTCFACQDWILSSTATCTSETHNCTYMRVCVCVCAHLPLDEGEVLLILACTEVQWDRDGQEPGEKERNGRREG